MAGLWRRPPQPQWRPPRITPSTAPPPPFDPASGFPWHQAEDERFYQPQCWPDPTTDLLYAFGPPPNAVQAQAFFPSDGDVLQAIPVPDDSIQSWAIGPPQNAAQAQAFNTPDEAAFSPTSDDTGQSYAIQPPAAAAFDPAAGFPWPREGDESQAQPDVDDTPQAWAVGPPQNAVIAQPVIGDSDVPQFIPTVDETSQAWPVQPPAAAPFDPANGFPYNADDSERFYQQQLTDDNVGYALGLVPQNATQAQAFNTPDEAAAVPVVDDTAQPWAIAPPAAAFDPSAGFPWPNDDIVQPVWTVSDPTEQAWAVGPLPMLRAFNSPEPEPILPAWIIDADQGQVWTATLGVVVAGGNPPTVIAVHAVPDAIAAHSLPTVLAEHSTPEH
jgi:hypothetical protein